MSINNIQRNYAGIPAEVKVSKKKASPRHATAPSSLNNKKEIKDTFETSEDEERKKFLESVKNKVSSGYYNSREVNEDLSHTLAKLLDETM